MTFFTVCSLGNFSDKVSKGSRLFPQEWWNVASEGDRVCTDVIDEGCQVLAAPLCETEAFPVLNLGWTKHLSPQWLGVHQAKQQGLRSPMRPDAWGARCVQACPCLCMLRHTHVQPMETIMQWPGIKFSLSERKTSSQYSGLHPGARLHNPWTSDHTRLLQWFIWLQHIAGHHLPKQQRVGTCSRWRYVTFPTQGTGHSRSKALLQGSSGPVFHGYLRASMSHIR